ncbi:MAG: membrane protein insertion efficiency factor YidD [Proteobacteria bacterium]|nr:membrane protein insertion efficiency factor YidD [Pseudomonadota bacterium]
MINKIFILLIRIYKFFLSPLLGNNCKFYPSCSEYAIEAFSTKPFHISLFLVVKRISRCNPWSRGGYDPLEVKEN